MKNSGWPQKTYEEQIARKVELEQRKKDKPRSQAARRGAKRTQQHTQEDAITLGNWKYNVRCLCNYTCQYPGCTYRDDHIDCHHVNPRSQRKDLIYVVANGKCLCSEHHDWVHKHPIQAIAMDLLRNRSRELAEKEGTSGVY